MSERTTPQLITDPRELARYGSASKYNRYSRDEYENRAGALSDREERETKRRQYEENILNPAHILLLREKRAELDAQIEEIRHEIKKQTAKVQREEAMLAMAGIMGSELQAQVDARIDFVKDEVQTAQAELKRGISRLQRRKTKLVKDYLNAGLPSDGEGVSGNLRAELMAKLAESQDSEPASPAGTNQASELPRVDEIGVVDAEVLDSGEDPDFVEPVVDADAVTIEEPEVLDDAETTQTDAEKLARAQALANAHWQKQLDEIETKLAEPLLGTERKKKLLEEKTQCATYTQAIQAGNFRDQLTQPGVNQPVRSVLEYFQDILQLMEGRELVTEKAKKQKIEVTEIVEAINALEPKTPEAERTHEELLAEAKLATEICLKAMLDYMRLDESPATEKDIAEMTVFFSLLLDQIKWFDNFFKKIEDESVYDFLKGVELSLKKEGGFKELLYNRAREALAAIEALPPEIKAQQLAEQADLDDAEAAADPEADKHKFEQLLEEAKEIAMSLFKEARVALDIKVFPDNAELDTAEKFHRTIDEIQAGNFLEEFTYPGIDHETGEELHKQSASIATLVNILATNLLLPKFVKESEAIMEQAKLVKAAIDKIRPFLEAQLQANKAAADTDATRVVPHLQETPEQKARREFDQRWQAQRQERVDEQKERDRRVAEEIRAARELEQVRAAQEAADARIRERQEAAEARRQAIIDAERAALQVKIDAKLSLGSRKDIAEGLKELAIAEDSIEIANLITRKTRHRNPFRWIENDKIARNKALAEIAQNRLAKDPAQPDVPVDPESALEAIRAMKGNKSRQNEEFQKIATVALGDGDRNKAYQITKEMSGALSYKLGKEVLKSIALSYDNKDEAVDFVDQSVSDTKAQDDIFVALVEKYQDRALIKKINRRGKRQDAEKLLKSKK